MLANQAMRSWAPATPVFAGKAGSYKGEARLKAENKKPPNLSIRGLLVECGGEEGI